MLAAHVTLTADDLYALRNLRCSVPVPDAVFRIEGPGTISCLQGLLTNDVSKLPDGNAAWGAFLTAKGMIISDAWIIRDGESAWVLIPGSARDTMRQLFARTMPPRLAKVVDQTDTVAVRWMVGGIPDAIAGVTIVQPHGPAPFTSLLLTTDAPAHDARLLAHGWVAAPASHGDALKVVAGWPTLGREIDERTLPQEVRFDELGGVKYDKGCYTGQETVARLHFRGHANRALRGVRWAPGDEPNDVNVSVGDKPIGTLRTIAQLGGERVALAMLRREVTAGDVVRTGDRDGVVIDLPFDITNSAVA